MALMMKNGKLLAHYFGGRLALTTDPDVCDCDCGGVTPEEGCFIPPDIAETLDITITSTNSLLTVSGTMTWTFDALDGGRWVWEDAERCCLDSELTQWCGISAWMYCNTVDHPLYNPAYPVDVYLVMVSSSMFDPAQNGGSVSIWTQPTTVTFNPLRVTGSFDAVFYDGDCGGESSGTYEIGE